MRRVRLSRLDAFGMPVSCRLCVDFCGGSVDGEVRDIRREEFEVEAQETRLACHRGCSTRGTSLFQGYKVIFEIGRSLYDDGGLPSDV